MKYRLDMELRGLRKYKIPATTTLLPFMNFAMKVFRCKSDHLVTVKTHRIAGYGGDTISVYEIEPKEAPDKLPCLVFFHGGGFMLKAADSHYQLAKEYAAKIPCKVIYADYRLAPKYPFPIPVEDCYAVYQWTIEHSEELQVDRNKIAVGGDSAGGNLAAAVSLMARDRGVICPRAALLVYPVTDRRMQTESMKKYIDTPVWDARLSKMMWKAYLGEQVPKNIAYVSPLEAVSLEGFPETYMEVAEYDCLRDEGILFFERLQKEGISGQLHKIKGACHGYERAAHSELMRKCMERRLAWIKNISYER